MNHPVGGHVRRPEAVVVEQEQGRDQNRSPGMREDRPRVRRREHAVAAGNVDQPLVERDAAKPARGPAMRPQLVIAGSPDDLPELRAQVPEAPVEPTGAVAHVAREDQPVIGMGRDVVQRFPVSPVGNMEVRNRPQTQGFITSEELARSRIRNRVSGRSPAPRNFRDGQASTRMHGRWCPRVSRHSRESSGIHSLKLSQMEDQRACTQCAVSPFGASFEHRHCVAVAAPRSASEFIDRPRLPGTCSIAPEGDPSPRFPGLRSGVAAGSKERQAAESGAKQSAETDVTPPRPFRIRVPDQGAGGHPRQGRRLPVA